MSGRDGTCERCGKKVKQEVWLVLDQRSWTYTDRDVPDEVSQGAFLFGPDCAQFELAEDRREWAKWEAKQCGGC